MSRATRPKIIYLPLSRATVLWCLAGFVACLTVYGVLSDTLTMTAFYPSPYGVYAKLMSTQNSILARDTGNVTIGEKQASPAGTLLMVGQVTSPSAALEVQGKTNISGDTTIGTGASPANLNVNGVASFTSAVQLANLAADPSPVPANGAMYYNTASNTTRVVVNNAWTDLGGGGGVSSLPSGTILTIDTGQPKPQCPSGMTAVSYNWGPTPCSSSCGSCTTGSGWGASPPATAQCPYTVNGQSCWLQGFKFVRQVCAPACVSATCTSNTWTQVQCHKP